MVAILVGSYLCIIMPHKHVEDIEVPAVDTLREPLLGGDVLFSCREVILLRIVG